MYERALGIRKDIPVAWNNKGSVLRRLGDYDDALAAYENAIILNPGISDALEGKCICLWHLARKDQIRSVLEVANERGIDLKRHFLSTASSLHGTRHLDEEIVIYKILLEFDHRDLGILFKIAHSFLELEQFGESLKELDKVLEIDPDQDEAWCQKSFLHVKMENWTDALEACDRALSLPNHANSCHLLMRKGSALSLLGRDEEGNHFYSRAWKVRDQIHDQKMLGLLSEILDQRGLPKRG